MRGWLGKSFLVIAIVVVTSLFWAAILGIRELQNNPIGLPTKTELSLEELKEALAKLSPDQLKDVLAKSFDGDVVMADGMC